MQLKDTLRYVVLGGIFILPFIPVIVTGFTFFPFITGKNFIFRIIVEIVLVAWVLLALLDREYRPRFSWLVISFLSFVGVMFVANLLSENVFKSMWSNFERMEGWVTLAHLAALLVAAVSVLAKEKLWTIFFNINVAVSVWLSLLGIKDLQDFFFREIGSSRIDSSFGNPTYFAIYNVFLIFITILMLRRNWQSTAAKVLYGIPLALQFVMLYYTATRGAILGFIGGMGLAAFLLAVFDPWRKEDESSQWFFNKYLLLALVPLSAVGAVAAFLVSAEPTVIWSLAAVLVAALIVPLFDRHRSLLSKAALGLILTMVALVGGFVAIKDTSFVQESDVLNRFAQISPTGGGVQSRLTIWAMAWEGVQERPILGWGQESFNFVFNKYYDPIMYNQEPWFDRTHNVILDWLIAGGFLGFTAYMAIPVVLMYYLWVYKRDDHPIDLVERALLTGLIAAYFFHNLFVFDNLVSWFLYVMILAYVHVRVTREEGKLLLPEFTIPKDTVKIVVAPVLLVVLVTFVYFANIRGLMVATDLVTALRLMSANNFVAAQELYDHAVDINFIGRQETAEQYVQAAARAGRSSIPDDMKELYKNQAIIAMQEQLNRVPNDARTQLFMGSYLASIGDPQNALTYLENARSASPEKQVILMEIGARRMALNQLEEAQVVLQEAYELETRFNDARELYALSLLQTASSTEEVQRLFVSEDGELLGNKDRFYVNASGTMIYDDDRFLRVLQTRGFHDHVIAVLEERLSRDPTSGQAHVSLAAGYAAAGNNAKAIEAIEQAIEINPAFEPQGREFIERIESGEFSQ